MSYKNGFLTEKRRDDRVVTQFRKDLKTSGITADSARISSTDTKQRCPQCTAANKYSKEAGKTSSPHFRGWRPVQSKLPNNRPLGPRGRHTAAPLHPRA